MTPISVRCALGGLLGVALATVLAMMFLPGSAWAQAPTPSPCPYLNLGLCTLEEGGCGVEVDRVCVTIKEANCLQAGLCIRDGSCGKEENHVCMTLPEASCLQAGGVWQNGTCVVTPSPPPGPPTSISPEPATLALVGTGLLGLALGRKWLRRRP